MTPSYTDDPVLVERVARALYERDRRGYFFGLFTDVEWDASRRKDRYRAEAHALCNWDPPRERTEGGGMSEGLGLPIWCENCRDHFDRDHHDESGMHGVGSEYGPYGELLQDSADLQALRRAAREALDAWDDPPSPTAEVIEAMGRLDDLLLPSDESGA